MFYETQCVAAGVDSVAHHHKLVYVWETLNYVTGGSYLFFIQQVKGTLDVWTPEFCNYVSLK